MGGVKNVVIAHCYGCDPSSHWFNWLKKELEKDGVKVFIPDFGQEEVPIFDKWAGILKGVIDDLKPSETILVGHSLGAALIPRVLSEFDGEAFFGTFLVAAPFTDLEWPTLRPFFKKCVVKKSASAKTGLVKIFASDNDPYVPLDHAYKYQNILGGEVVVENGKDHLGGDKYERLKEEIRKAGV